VAELDGTIALQIGCFGVYLGTPENRGVPVRIWVWPYINRSKRSLQILLGGPLELGHEASDVIGESA
jgi:hypothetical protein